MPLALTRRQLLASLAAVTAGTMAVTSCSGVPAASTPRIDDLVTRCRIGAYAHNEPWPSVNAHFRLEDALGASLPIASWFVDFPARWQDVVNQADQLTARGQYDILLCWQPAHVQFTSIINGDHDEMIRKFIQGASRYPGTVVIRPFHEANGDWYDWAPGSGRGYVADADEWKKGWIHLVQVARSVAAPNVRFFWCMNAGDRGGITLEELFPGSAWADIVGHDAYSWAGSGTSFDDIHKVTYDRITALHPTAEFWIGECGLEQKEGFPVDAATWYRDAYQSQHFPRMKTLCWFHADPFRLDAASAVRRIHHTELNRAPR
jgi:hypothetical protein